MRNPASTSSTQVKSNGINVQVKKSDHDVDLSSNTSSESRSSEKRKTPTPKSYENARSFESFIPRQVKSWLFKKVDFNKFRSKQQKKSHITITMIKICQTITLYIVLFKNH